MTQIYAKISFTLFSILFLLNSSNAQIYQWAKSIGGPNSDVGHSIAYDAAGNVYTAGAFQGNVDFDPGTGTTSLISNGSFDIFVTKFDAAGNFIWVKTMGASLDDRAYAIALDATGNVYITGYFKGTVDFDPSTTASSFLTAVGADDMYICKLTSAGNFVWVKQIGGTDIERGKSISIDATGNILTTGYFAGTADFDPSSIINTLSSAAGFFDIFVLKLNSNGDYVWAERFGVSNLDEGHAITSDGIGNIYVTGEYDGSVDFDPGAGVSNLISLGAYDIFVLKLTSAGALVWAKSMGGQSYDSGSGIAVDASGNVYTTGLFGDVADFDPGASIFSMTAAGGNIDKDIFISKLSSTGAFVWAKRMGGTGDDQGNTISLDDAGNVYTAGIFHGTVDFDPGAGASNFTTVFGTDIYISKLNPSGAYVFALQMGGGFDDDPQCIKVDASGNYIYLTGEYQGTEADFDPGAGVVGLNSLGSYDAFVLKLGRYKAGIDTKTSSAAISVYPNPSSGNLRVTLDNYLNNSKLSVKDMMGKEVYTLQVLNENSIALDLNFLSRGVYFIKLENKEEQSTIKFVKD